MLLHILYLSLVGILLVLGGVALFLDLLGYAETVEKYIPWLGRFMKRREILFALLLFAIGFLMKDFHDVIAIAPPPPGRMPPPPAPVIQTEPRIVTQEPKKQCWVSNHFGLPNSTITGAVTATAAIIHCNAKIEAPFVVTVEFDRDFIPGALVLPDSGAWMGGGNGKQGRVYMGQINSPALLSDQLIVVTVYGDTDQYPRAIRASVQARK